MAISPAYEQTKRNMLRERARTSGPVAVALRLRRASRQGQFPDLELGDYYKVGDGCCKALLALDDDQLTKLVNYSTGRMADSERVEAQRTFETVLAANLGPLGGSLIDLIIQLMPVLIEMFAGCFA